MMGKKTVKKWMGDVGRCEFCEVDLNEEEYFIDGATSLGPWAMMCETCHIRYGRGLGMGKGQKYLTSTREKIEG